ncbi:hypothetical protein [Hydrogenophaga sp.]|jgi:hypothetical protein|uniref:hypothetical protein n=1 Tax=Hydrogenophaga sp. TaxID=1904254 RepID=UPI003F7020C5
MRRWLLALFALQFFCSVSAFTFANTDALESSPNTAGVVVEASKASLDMTVKGTMSALDAVHGLLDEIPELPECLDVAIGEMTVATPWDLPRDHLIIEWTPPALDGPQRPPRSFIALA